MAMKMSRDYYWALQDMEDLKMLPEGHMKKREKNEIISRLEGMKCRCRNKQELARIERTIKGAENL